MNRQSGRNKSRRHNATSHLASVRQEQRRSDAIFTNNEPQHVVLVREESSLWQGPLPHPDALRQFEEIVPGAAERIFAMAENQSRHRMELENRVVNAELKRSFCGLWCATGLTALFACVSAFAISYGYHVAAGTIAGIPTAGLIYCFIYGTKSRREERKKRADVMSGKGEKPSK